MTSYFEARNVAPESTDRSELPPWFDQVLPPSREARILDIGCGQGGYLLALRDLGYSRAEGLEFDEAAVARCQAHGLTARRSDIVEENLADMGKFDLVIMNHVLEHLPKDKMIEVAAKIRSVLAPGGRLFLAVPNAQSNTGAYWAFEDFTHTFLFTSGSVYYVARMAGFTEVEFIDINCTAGVSWPVRLCRNVLMSLYRANRTFWNKVTRSIYHNESVDIFSFEIKALLSG